MKPGDLRKFLENETSLRDSLAYAYGKTFMILSMDDRYNVCILINGRVDTNWSEPGLRHLSVALNET